MNQCIAANIKYPVHINSKEFHLIASLIFNLQCENSKEAQCAEESLLYRVMGSGIKAHIYLKTLLYSILNVISRLVHFTISGLLFDL